jgi:hypothetical protein
MKLIRRRGSTTILPNTGGVGGGSDATETARCLHLLHEYEVKKVKI